jgi:large subunit ribosomal protein L20
MPRVRKGAARTQARKRILRQARGFFGVRSKHKYQAENQLVRGGVFALRDRRFRKRDYRGLWIIRITAACKMRGTRYSLFINGLKRAGCVLNRKMLSNLAVEDPKLFDALVATAIKATKATPAKTKA